MRRLATTCLNRTSVGLKHEHLAVAVDQEHRLNRTSVGLKLGQLHRVGVEKRRLNRTSVGLKPAGKRRQGPSAAASIEPAWD